MSAAPQLDDIGAGDIPRDLTERVIWGRMKLTAAPTPENPHKLKKDPLGIESNDPSTWRPYGYAAENLRDGQVLAIALGHGLAGVDLDGCRDRETGKLDARAQQIVGRFPGAYVEVSPSGTGVKLTFRYSGDPLAGVKHDGVELYCRDRLWTVTGDQLGECDAPLPDLTAQFLALREQITSAAKPKRGKLGRNREGSRNNKTYDALLSGEGQAEAREAGEAGVRKYAAFYNETYNEPPLSAVELGDIIKSALGSNVLREVLAEREAALAPPPPPPEPRTIEEVVEAYRKRYVLHDPAPLYAVLGAYAANIMYPELRQPVWLLVVGPPSYGKTSLLNLLRRAPHVIDGSQITGPGALLSGSSRKDRSKASTGGLLVQGGVLFVLSLKDYTSLLSMKHETRTELFGAFREIYDGRWDRHLGVDGGNHLSWSGKMGLVAGCTPAIDDVAPEVGRMGERALMIRVGSEDLDELCGRAADGLWTGKADEDAAEEAALGLLGHAQPAPPPAWSEDERARLFALAQLLARGRAPVVRDRYTRDIESVPGAESPTRIIEQLSIMFAGMVSLGVERDECWRVLGRLVHDGLPPSRARLLDVLVQRPVENHRPHELAAELLLSNSAARRVCDDVAAYGLADKIAGDRGAEAYRASAELRRLALASGVFPQDPVPPVSQVARTFPQTPLPQTALALSPPVSIKPKNCARGFCGNEPEVKR